jgi:CRP-like cAMP-binding protein
VTDLDARMRTLSTVSLFAGLPPETVVRIARCAAPYDVPAGQILIESNTPGAGMFVIEDGVVEVHTHSRTLELGSGECIGELALLTAEGLRSARVQAKTPVRCLAIRRDDFQSILRDDHALALWLLEVVATRLAEASAA